jgi:cell shape-determining protein MreC
MLHPQSTSPRIELLALLLCCGISLFLLCLPDQSQRDVAAVLGTFARPWRNARDFVRDVDEVREKAAQLAADKAELELEVARLQRRLAEERRLREDQRLPLPLPEKSFRGRLVPCQVMARLHDRAATLLLVESLEAFSCEPYQAVIAPADHDSARIGLIGRVKEVDGRKIWVELLTDPEMSVGCEVARNGVAGVLRGQGRNMLLDYVGRDEDVRPGDLIITSGLAETFRGSNLPWAFTPRGIPVGVVLGSSPPVPQKRASHLLDVRVRPLASFQYNETLFVVVPGGEAGRAMARGFAGGGGGGAARQGADDTATQDAERP